MKVIIEYGTQNVLITISGVEAVTQLPFGYHITLAKDSSVTLDDNKVHSMEIIPDA